MDGLSLYLSDQARSKDKEDERRVHQPRMIEVKGPPLAPAELLHGMFAGARSGHDRVEFASPSADGHPAIDPRIYTLRAKRDRKPSPLSPTREQAVARPSKKPASVSSVEWVDECLRKQGGVIAAVPCTAEEEGTIASLDGSLASGNGAYWVLRLEDLHANFKSVTSTSSLGEDIVKMDAVTLHTGAAPFLPEGDVLGKKLSYLDQFVDAGFTVTIKSRPYCGENYPICAKDSEKQHLLCAKEVCLLTSAAEHGIAPCVLATFYANGDADSEESKDVAEQIAASTLEDWQVYTEPNQKVSASAATNTGRVDSLVTVSEVSTFSLGDLMHATRHATNAAQKEHLLGVLKTSVSITLDHIKDMCKVRKGFGTVKLNMTPDSVVFCPKLVESESGWRLEGVGHLPVSDRHLDGVPKLVDFNSLLCAQIHSSAYSPHSSYLLHGLLLAAFTRATYGATVTRVVTDRLFEEGDPAGFVAAAKAVSSTNANVSSFLAALAAQTEMHEDNGVYRGVAEAVSQLDSAVCKNIVDKSGKLCDSYANEPFFNRLVCAVKNVSSADTRIFSQEMTNEEFELEHAFAINEIKRARNCRLVQVTTSE